MYKAFLFSLITFVSINDGFSQSNFQYLSNFTYDTEINDAVEYKGNYYLVGSIDSSGKSMPRLSVIDKNANLVLDTILPIEGYYSNIHVVDSLFYVSISYEIIGMVLSDFLVFDTVFNIVGSIAITGDVYIQKSRLINDSIIASVGDYHDFYIGNAYASITNLTNIKTEDTYSNYQSYGPSVVSTYDILPHPNGFYLFMNSPDSTVSNQVSIYNLDDSLYVVDSASVNTSYSQFINNSPLLGPVTAVSLGDSNFMLNGHLERPRYANQAIAKDIGLMVLDSNFNEQKLDYAGKTDTNSSSGRNSVASLDGYFYLGNTENINGLSEFMVSKADSTGNILWTKYYKNSASIELNKILATSDQHLLLIGSYQSGSGVKQAFAIKTDTTLNYLVTAIKELGIEERAFKVYPSPFSDQITIELEDAPKNAEAAIYDVNGKLLKRFEITSESENLDVSFFPSGVYFIRLEAEGKAFSQKTIKL